MTCGERGGNHRHELGHLTVDNDGVETVLASEVFVDNGLGNLRGRCDLLDRDGLESLFREQ